MLGEKTQSLPSLQGAMAKSPRTTKIYYLRTFEKTRGETGARVPPIRGREKRRREWGGGERMKFELKFF